MFVDGSYKREDGVRRIGFGIVIYENGAEIRREYGGNILPLEASPHNGSYIAERIAIIEALDCLRYWGYRDREIILYHDCSLNPKKFETSQYVYLSRFRYLRFQQISRKRNKVADRLALKGRLGVSGRAHLIGGSKPLSLPEDPLPTWSQGSSSTSPR